MIFFRCAPYTNDDGNVVIERGGNDWHATLHKPSDNVNCFNCLIVACLGDKTALYSTHNITTITANKQTSPNDGAQHFELCRATLGQRISDLSPDRAAIAVAVHGSAVFG